MKISLPTTFFMPSTGKILIAPYFTYYFSAVLLLSALNVQAENGATPPPPNFEFPRDYSPAEAQVADERAIHAAFIKLLFGTRKKCHILAEMLFTTNIADDDASHADEERDDNSSDDEDNDSLSTLSSASEQKGEERDDVAVLEYFAEDPIAGLRQLCINLYTIYLDENFDPKTHFIPLHASLRKFINALRLTSLAGASFLEEIQDTIAMVEDAFIPSSGAEEAAEG